MVDGEGEVQASLCQWTGSVEGRTPGHGLRDRRNRVTDRGWLTPRVIDKHKCTWRSDRIDQVKTTVEQVKWRL